MTRAAQTNVQMRILIEDPVAGVRHSLQNKQNHPVDPVTSKDGEDIAFDFVIRVGDGPKFYGEQVRSEGSTRRFVYVAVGQLAGDPGSCWSRRMKIDIHNIPEPLLDGARAGRRLTAAIAGKGADNTPSCATVRVRDWRLD